jgi:nicotinamidase-related amidase
MTVTALDPKTALVLIDLQAGFLAQQLHPFSAAETVARGRELAEAFRGHGLQVVLVNVSFSKDLADFPPGRIEEGGMDQLPPAGWDHLVADLGAQECDLRITKRNWGTFHGTGLDTQLRRRGITQIVLGGIRTSIGVESTAREAFAHGYSVTLATDAMSDSSLPMHENSVERVFPRLGERGTTAEIIELLNKTHG